jgi:polyhydroxybutyrate depolymerase
MRAPATFPSLATLVCAAALAGALGACHGDAPPAAGPFDSGPALVPDATTPAPDAGGLAPDGSPACRGTMLAAGSQMGQLVVGGRMRTFLLHVPTGYDGRRALPLVVLLHGGLGTGQQLEASSLMSPIADREGFVVVYPDGLERTWNAGGCCAPAASQNIDDVGFIAALLDQLGAQLCLDRRRVYAGGMSNGAMLTHRLACELSDRLAAVAPVSGTNMAATCAPKRAVPLFEVHGTDDHHVPWAGGVGCGLSKTPYTSVPDTIAGWLQRDGCTPAPPALFVEQGDGRCERQGRCPDDGDVILCTIAGGGHSWPGGAAKETDLPGCQQVGEGGQSRTFFASEQIWAFFKTHALP